MQNKECVAMILAGGQGSRLGVLTKDNAKPAVPFGGKHRIIDFTLSNCSHAGLDVVGVATQYQPLELNTYIGSGKIWGLDKRGGGVFILPPYVSAEKSEWYKGTANAIYQNISFINQYDPELVLILSGDHIYKMDYSDMIEFHKKNNADVTVSAMPVPISEASRFGIMKCNDDSQIIDFDEKPAVPKSNIASMGVYLFNWKTLKRFLVIDENNPNSCNDFGKNIIPAVLESKERLFAYIFNGYWRDVGTVQSLWEANMDILGDNPELDIETWDVHSISTFEPPHYISSTGSVRNSRISEGCIIHGTVEDSILSPGVVVEEGALIRGSVVMAGSYIGENASINKAIIGRNTKISDNVIIGAIDITDNIHFSEMCTGNITAIGSDLVVGKDVVIGQNCMIDKDIHTQGEFSFITNNVEENVILTG